MTNVRIGIAVAVLYAVVFAPSVLFGQDNSTREAKDRTEIEELMWRYTRALDTGDGTAYAATYTVDLERVNGKWLIKLRDVAPKD